MQFAFHGLQSLEHALAFGHGKAINLSLGIGERYSLTRVEYGKDFAHIPLPDYWSAGVTMAKMPKSKRAQPIARNVEGLPNWIDFATGG